MSAEQVSVNPGWVPQTCTLPTSEQPLRVAEFDELFGTAVRRAERLGPDQLRLELVCDDQVAARAASLAVRETSCCSLFTFTLTAAEDRLMLEVRVPDPHTDVLDALAARVATRARR